eukprot:2287217-Prorocentrum_lima.AAC.1
MESHQRPADGRGKNPRRGRSDRTAEFGSVRNDMMEWQSGDVACLCRLDEHRAVNGQTCTLTEW